MVRMNEAVGILDLVVSTMGKQPIHHSCPLISEGKVQRRSTRRWVVVRLVDLGSVLLYQRFDIVELACSRSTAERLVLVCAAVFLEEGRELVLKQA